METVTVQVELRERGYPIRIGSGLLATAGRLIAERIAGRQALIVSDENVAAQYADGLLRSMRDAGFDAGLATIPAGEASKTLRYASRVWDLLVDRKADRRSVVVALGGGVVGDLAGFAAATFARGIGFAQVPTSLLAMVDASVGGKVAVDHPRAKNMIGAFHQPAIVVCDLDTLTSLSDRQYRCGVAEVVKHGVILDAPLFEFLEQHADDVRRRDPETVRHLVVRSCQIKGDVVAQDEFERTGLRAVLNYGHTFAHALETASGYQDLLHGEAVAIGMVCAGRLALELGRVTEEFCVRQERLLTALGLPTRVPAGLLRRDLVDSMRRDKKAVGGSLRFILPSALGSVEMVADVSAESVDTVMRQLAD